MFFYEHHKKLQDIKYGKSEPDFKIHSINNEISSFNYDIQLLLSILLLVGIGTVMVYSASSALALKKYGTSYYFFKKQITSVLIGCLAMIICKHIPYRIYKNISYLFLVSAFCFLAALYVPGWGHTAGGATRWLRFMGLSFQPSEFARFALVIYLAYSMSKKQEKIQNFSVGFLPHAMVLGIFMILIVLQPDFGSFVIMGALAWIMLFVGGVRFAHLISCILLMLPVGYFFIIHAQYRLERILSFLNPWEYQSEAGYQIIHSLMAFGTGGLWGRGIGKGYQKLFYLPEPHTDFIFSVIGEELGMFGTLGIITLYFIFVCRGFSLSKKSTDLFGSYLALGLTAAIALQVCINISVTLGLLPTKGLTLPFLSYGGTSLIINMAAVGILMNIKSE
ncbi:putative peptidoglycan glycosyltransferase FtsW [Candidatus Magnetomoraceae bacterium gMMP-15]